MGAIQSAINQAITVGGLLYTQTGQYKAKQEEIAKLTSKARRTIKSIMSKMQDKRIIGRVGGKKNGKWVVL